MAKGRYLPCRLQDIPNGVRFHVPPQNAGQIVEVSYGDFGDTPAVRGARYKKVHDQSIGPAAIEYFVWVADDKP